MAEVAANIESRVSLEEHRIAIDEKCSKADLAMRLKDKISFDDMKLYVAQHAGRPTGDRFESNANERNLDMFEDDMRRLKARLDDTYHEV